MVSDGVGFGVIWDNHTIPGHGMRFARLDAQGNYIGDSVRLDSGEAHASSARLLWAGGAYAAVWAEDSASYFRRISERGALQSNEVLIMSGLWDAPRIRFRNAAYEIVGIQASAQSPTKTIGIKCAPL